jgi:ribulose kinase
MTEYYFPSLMYIKDNLKNIFDSIYKDIDFEYDFIVYNETERILKSKDDFSNRSLMTLVQKESIDYMREVYRENKYNPSNFANFNIEENANALKKIFYEKVSN